MNLLIVMVTLPDTIRNTTAMKITEATKELIKYGSILAGNTAGAALAISNEDPLIQISGTAIGGILPEILNDFARRFLSTREKIKVAAVIHFATEGIVKNINSGKQTNNDFLNMIEEGKRTSAEELYEGILIKAKNEFQEKKIKHVGAIFANCIFTKDVTPEDVNHLLSAVEKLTYRKLRIIALYGKKEYIFPERNIMKDPYIWYDNISFSLSTRAVLQDIFELGNFGIIDFQRLHVTDHLSLTPERFQLTDLGEQYFELMGLDEISPQEMEPEIDAIEYKAYYGKNIYGQINCGLPNE